MFELVFIGGFCGMFIVGNGVFVLCFVIDVIFFSGSVGVNIYSLVIVSIG